MVVPAVSPGVATQMDMVPQSLLHPLETSANPMSRPTGKLNPIMSASPSQDTPETHPLTRGKKKTHNGSEICNTTEPVSCAMLTQAKFYMLNVSGSQPCRFSCYYDPSQMSPLRLEVHEHYQHPMKSPVYVSVQQDFYISSWTLPIIFPVMGEDQKFTSLETLLCPPEGDKNETVDFSLSTRGADNKGLQIALHNVSFILQKNVNVSFTVSPVSPWYKRYLWAASEESVLVTAESNKDSDSHICALLVLQNAKCPVHSEVSGLTDRGRYQTFTKRAGMVARKSDFPDGIHAIVISLPDDEACILNPSAASHNKTSNRKKTVVLEVFNHATIGTTWYIFFMTGIVLAVVTIAATVVICFLIKRTLSPYGPQTVDGRPLLEGSRENLIYRVEVGGGVAMGGRESTQTCNIPPGLGNNLPQNNLDHEGEHLGPGILGEGARGAERQGLLALEASDRGLGAGAHGGGRAIIVTQPAPQVLPPTTYSPQGEALILDNTFNPLFVWWWKSVAVHESKTAEAQVSEVGFQNSLVIMGVFAALPMSELLRSYLGMVLHHGQEDLCFWNSRCLTTFAMLPDFTRVFSNLSYIQLGIAFVFIVRKHRNATYSILQGMTPENSVGVCRNYGLFTSLGYGLIMQGVMSALYHTCPNSVTIKFDLMFMYVMMVVSVVTIWGLRHGDVTHHVYPTVIAVGLALIMAEARLWLSYEWFWGIFSTIYAIILISNAMFMSVYGIWSFSLPKLWQAWSGWREVMRKLKNVLEEQDTTSRPMQVVRPMVGVGINIGLMLYGILDDPNFYYFILIVCLVNMGVYFANYVVAKRLGFKEKGTLLGWTCLTLSSVLWVIALAFFFQKRTDSEGSPAESRAKNSPCDFLSVYDEHDIWHITSSFALFFFFVALLTMDDDLFSTPAKDIKVA